MLAAKISRTAKWGTTDRHQINTQHMNNQKIKNKAANQIEKAITTKSANSNCLYFDEL